MNKQIQILMGLPKTQEMLNDYEPITDIDGDMVIAEYRKTVFCIYISPEELKRIGCWCIQFNKSIKEYLYTNGCKYIDSQIKKGNKETLEEKKLWSKSKQVFYTPLLIIKE